MRFSLAPTRAIVLALVTTAAVSLAAAQQPKNKTVIEKATEQFEDTPLKVSSIDNGLFLFSGDGGNVVGVVDDGSTLLIDSGLDTRVTELSAAVYKATARPVTRVVNTHWHFDHTGGNLFFGTSGVTIIGQENLKKQLSSAQNVPFIGLHDGPYPPAALPSVTYSTSMILQQGSHQLSL